MGDTSPGGGRWRRAVVTTLLSPFDLRSFTAPGPPSTPAGTKFPRPGPSLHPGVGGGTRQVVCRWGHPGAERGQRTPSPSPPPPRDPPGHGERGRKPSARGHRPLAGQRVTMGDARHGDPPPQHLPPSHGGCPGGVSPQPQRGDWVPLDALGRPFVTHPVPPPRCEHPGGNPGGNLGVVVVGGDPKTLPPPPLSGCTHGCCLPSPGAAAATPGCGSAAGPPTPARPSWGAAGGDVWVTAVGRGGGGHREAPATPMAPCAGPRVGRASCWGSGSGRAASDGVWPPGAELAFFGGCCHLVTRHPPPGKAEAHPAGNRTGGDAAVVGMAAGGCVRVWKNDPPRICILAPSAIDAGEERGGGDGDKPGRGNVSPRPRGGRVPAAGALGAHGGRAEAAAAATPALPTAVGFGGTRWAGAGEGEGSGHGSGMGTTLGVALGG